MPSVKLNSRITFSGGGGGGPTLFEPVGGSSELLLQPAPPPPPPVFTSTYPELSGQEYATEEAKTAAETTVDQQKTDASTAVLVLLSMLKM